MLRKEQKTAIIDANRTHEGDTGSPEVQVAILTERINVLTEHMRKIQRIVLRFGSGRRSTRCERLSAVQMSEQLI